MGRTLGGLDEGEVQPGGELLPVDHPLVFGNVDASDRVAVCDELVGAKDAHPKKRAQRQDHRRREEYPKDPSIHVWLPFHNLPFILYNM